MRYYLLLLSFTKDVPTMFIVAGLRKIESNGYETHFEPEI